MQPLGRKMFKGAAAGATLGAVGGGIYGNMRAQKLIDAEPYDSVEISGKFDPGFKMGTDGDGGFWIKKTQFKLPTVEAKKSNADTIRLENIVTYAVIGTVAGGVGGALTAAVLEAATGKN